MRPSGVTATVAGFCDGRWLLGLTARLPLTDRHAHPRPVLSQFTRTDRDGPGEPECRPPCAEVEGSP